MNFLAHLHLSGDSDEIRIGNFIGDYVKGQRYNHYPEGIRKGILLHRSIDNFTDHHDEFLLSTKKFSQVYGKYSGIVADLVFDHLLAKNWDRYHHDRLRDFTRDSHALLLSQFDLLPSEVRQFLPFMIQHRRLESYATSEGICHSLDIMNNYTSLPHGSGFVAQVLKTDLAELEGIFEKFMDAIILYVIQNHDINIHRP